MNEIFDWCVEFLEFLGPKFGMSYKEINVWIFVIIGPLNVLLQWIYISYLKGSLEKERRIVNL